jgi:hypothetical protein
MKSSRSRQTNSSMIASIGEDQNNAPKGKSDHVDRYEPRSLDTHLLVEERCAKKRRSMVAAPSSTV